MKTTFENLYDAYCPMLCNIALQICPSKTKAEEILVLTFKKVYMQRMEWMEKKFFFVDLVKLVIQTAKEEFYPGETKCNFKIKEFENTPILHQLLVEQLSLENCCVRNNITRHEALINIRNEFMLISSTFTNKYPAVDINYIHLN